MLPAQHRKCHFVTHRQLSTTKNHLAVTQTPHSVICILQFTILRRLRRPAILATPQRRFFHCYEKFSMRICLREMLICLVSAILPSVLACRPVAAQEPSYPDPLIRQRADPWVYNHTDGFYYFSGTVPEYDRIELRRSRTVSGLRNAEPVVVWRKHERGPMSWHIWAPEIHHVDGKWYVYFAAGRAEAVWDIRIYVLECAGVNPLENSWVERGQLKTNWESFSLDATTFTHRGKRYLCWAQKDPEMRGNTNLYIAEMSSPWAIKGKQVMITRPEFDWERIGFWVNEGPAMVHRKGRVFITYSASATDANYCVGLLTAAEDADLLDPKSWQKSQVPVLQTSEADKLFGPGHGCFTVAEDGKTDLFVFHARSYKQIQGDPLNNPDRHTRVRVLDWNKDGTPDFGN